MLSKTQYICHSVSFFLVLMQLSETSAQQRYNDVSPFDVETQCGATLDFQDVSQYDGTYGVTQQFTANQQAPVGQHVDAGCSGTLISNDLFLSAGHCAYQVGDTVRFNFQLDANGSTPNSEDFEVLEVLEQENNNDLDYAIVRLANSPGLTYGFALLTDREPMSGELLTIIGHPDSMPKQISTGPYTTITSGLGDNWFRHQSDTLGGSSGSGVLDNRGYIIGLHTNAGCRQTNNNIQGNHAMRMSVLLNNSAVLSQIFQDTPVSTWQLKGRPTAADKIAWCNPEHIRTLYALNGNRDIYYNLYEGYNSAWVLIGNAWAARDISCSDRLHAINDDNSVWRNLNNAGQPFNFQWVSNASATREIGGLDTLTAINDDGSVWRWGTDRWISTGNSFPSFESAELVGNVTYLSQEDDFYLSTPTRITPTRIEKDPLFRHEQIIDIAAESEHIVWILTSSKYLYRVVVRH